jgi:hypothetical protein
MNTRPTDEETARCLVEDDEQEMAQALVEAAEEETAEQRRSRSVYWNQLTPKQQAKILKREARRKRAMDIQIACLDPSRMNR